MTKITCTYSFKKVDAETYEVWVGTKEHKIFVCNISTHEIPEGMTKGQFVDRLIKIAGYANKKDFYQTKTF